MLQRRVQGWPLRILYREILDRIKHKAGRDDFEK